MLRRLIASVLLLACAVSAQNKRPFTFEDMMKLKRIGDPQVSPDGRWVLFMAVDVDLEANTKTSHIWLVPLAGGESVQLTRGAGEDRARWSPDGKHFLYGADDQIWMSDFDAASGQAQNPRKVTSIATGASGALWSPDGKNIVFTSSVWPECDSAGDAAAQNDCNKKKDDDIARSKVRARVFTHLLYRHWTAFTGGKRSHLFVQPVAGDLGLSEGAAAARPPANWRDLTPGDHDVPPFSLGGQDDYAISPDGKEVCYTSNHDEVEAISTNNDLFIVPLAGGAAKKITTNPASDSSPLYSPDGKYIAYRAQVRPGYESDRFRLMLYERTTGKIRNLTESFDEWVGTIDWTPDSKRVYFTSEEAGAAPIYYVAVDAPNVVYEVLGADNDDLTFTKDGRSLVFSRVSVQAPTEIFVADVSRLGPHKVAASLRESSSDEGRAQQLTHLNSPVLSQVSMQPLEPFWFTGSENAKVQGFLVKPPNFDEHKKYPVKFLIHGGPQGAWGDSWSYRWNPELFAANGYVVVMINPRGSTGYGQKFIDDINGDWGGRAYQDLMLGLDYVEKTYRFVDKNRECALGASYGGYMANWLEGHTTRFKCIVSHDGMFNAESAYGTTEELWFNEWEFKGMPWTNRALYQKWSPHMYAQNFKTPMLVVHTQLDYRLDVSEGFQLFTTLQRLKVPSKMLYFPDEGHWVMKPQNSRLWYKTVNEWVDQWAKQH